MKLLTAVLIVGVPLPAIAQADPARREAVYRRMLELRTLVKGGVVQPNWMADSSSFWYVDSTPDRTVALRVDPPHNQVTPLLDVSRTRDVLSAQVGHPVPYQGLPFPTLTLMPGEVKARFTFEGSDWVIDRERYTLLRVPTPSAAEVDRRTPRLVRRVYPVAGPDVRELPSPDGKWFATELGGNLELRSTVDGRTQALTRDVVEGFDWGVSGAIWSPNGLRLGALKTDTRGVAKVPLVHWLKPVEEVTWLPFPKVGGKLPRTEVHLIDVVSGRDVRADLGDETDQFLSLIGWTPNGAEMLLYRMARDMKRLEVVAVSAATAKARTVLTETQPTFIKNISTLGGGSCSPHSTTASGSSGSRSVTGGTISTSTASTAP